MPSGTDKKGAAASADGAPEKSWAVYFGDLHTHCSKSDGKGTPEEAYSYARDEAKVDFLALTDHNKAKLTRKAVGEVVSAAAREKRPGFAPLFGQEFSTDKPNNHINVFGIEEPIPEAFDNDFRRLYREWLPAYTNRHPGGPVFCQFNHPASKNRDYGIAPVTVKDRRIVNYNGDWAGFAADADPWVKLIALVNGPAKIKAGAPAHGLHMDIGDNLGTWFFYLDKGFHLSPTCNQDTHVASWGDLTTGRTGVWLDEPLSGEALMKALSEGRCFATEDKGLSLWLSVGGAPMGARLADTGTTNLTVVVKVDDRDGPGSVYTVELYGDAVGDGKPAEVFATGTVSPGGAYTNAFPHTGGVSEFCLAHVKQAGSEDDAWSAPVYIGPRTRQSPHGNTGAAAGPAKGVRRGQSR